MNINGVDFRRVRERADQIAADLVRTPGEKYCQIKATLLAFAELYPGMMGDSLEVNPLS